MNPKKKKRVYNPPVVSDATAVPLEVLLTASTFINQSLVIEGQSVQSFYEDEDLLSVWDWD